jgi:hypothetical protein
MNISVPDDLAEKVRAHELPISAICQGALGRAVAAAEAKAKKSQDIVAVAQRLKKSAAMEEKIKGQGRSDGDRWARWYADASELASTARGNALNNARIVLTSVTGRAFFGATYNGRSPGEDDHLYWQGFTKAAREIWDEALPLLEASSNDE